MDLRRPLRLAAWFLGAGLLLAACADGGGSLAPTATTTVGPTTAPPATVTPRLEQTGIPEVDAVIDAVLSGDPEALRLLIRFTVVLCEVEPRGIGSPPECRLEESDRTPIDVLPAAQCEGHYIRADEMDRALSSMADPEADLYAVHRTTGGYRAVFSRLVGPQRILAGHALLIEDGQVVNVNFGCGETPEELVGSVDSEDLLLPPPSPTLSPGAPTGY